MSVPTPPSDRPSGPSRAAAPAAAADDRGAVPLAVSLVRRLESATALDPVVRALRPVVGALVADPVRRDALRGAWLGHALHPVLSDLPIGFWTSATVLDVVGGPSARPAAQRLVALGLLTAGPTAITGWAEWGGTETREQRVGVVHAVSNATAVVVFAASWRARRNGRHLRGAALSAVATSALTVGGYLGGHLTSVRKVGSSHPAFGS